MHNSWKSGGGGVLEVLAKVLLGGYLGLSENLGGGVHFYCLFCVFIAFLCDNFSELTPSPIYVDIIGVLAVFAMATSSKFLGKLEDSMIRE